MQKDLSEYDPSQNWLSENSPIESDHQYWKGDNVGAQPEETGDVQCVSGPSENYH